MWRIVSVIRGIRGKFGNNCRTSQQVAFSNEDETETRLACVKEPQVKLTHSFFNKKFDDHGQNSRRRTCRNCRIPYDLNFYCFLEGLKTGGAILFGLQLLYHRFLNQYNGKNGQLSRIQTDVSNTLRQLLFALPLPNNGRLSILPETSNEFLVLDTEVKTTNDSAKVVPSFKSSEATQLTSDEDLFDGICFDSSSSRTNERSSSEEKKQVLDDSFSAAVDELKNAADAYAAEVQNQFGIQFTQNKNYSQALKFFEASCELGNSKACFNLGICYELGLGTEQNFAKACDSYQKAAEKGHSAAIYNLGVYYMEGRDAVQKDTDKALGLLEEAADKGVKEAQRYMGAHYIEEGDMQKAVSYLQSAVKLKDVDAEYYLGVCYENGWGVEENSAKAAQMYAQAAAGNQVDALYNLATFHELGLGGLPPSRTTAMELLSTAASLGHEISSSRLKHLQEKETQLQDKLLRIKSLRIASSPELHLTVPSSGGAPLSRKVNSESLLSHWSSLITNAFETKPTKQHRSAWDNDKIWSFEHSFGTNSNEIAIFT